MKTFKGLIFFMMIFGLMFYAGTALGQNETAAPKQQENTRQEAPKEETNEGRVIKDIQAKGNKIVSSATILAKIKSKIGGTYDSHILNEDIKRLYATGFFTDVSIDVERLDDGVKITIMVSERFLIEAVVIQGNKLFREEKIKEKIKSKIGEMIDPKQLNDDLSEIRNMYEDKGYQLVDVSYDVKVDEQTNKATIFIKIDEKQRIKIKKIFVVGNKAIPAKRILRTLATKPASLFNAGVFKEEIFRDDIEKVKDLYDNMGYMDVHVDYQTKYDDKMKFMYITIKIDEGKKFLVGTITISGNSVFTVAQLKKNLELTPAKAFSRNLLRQDIYSVQENYFNKGYISAQVHAEPQINPQTGKIDLAYSIVENDLTYVDKIEIRGNTKTKDKVIRRLIKLTPGEIFDGSKLKRSKERIYNLGYFEEVNYEIEPGSAPNKKDLAIEVKETKTGEFSFGGGWSSVDKLVGFVQVEQKNFDLFNFPYFTGAGQYLTLRGEFGTIRRDYDISFTEPYIFDFPYLFGVDFYQRTHERSQDTGYGYDSQTTGFNLRSGREINDLWRTDVVYSMDSIKISNVTSGATADLLDEVGTNRLSSLTWSVTRDDRDNIFNPGHGSLSVASAKCAGGPVFGGDKSFVKYLGTSAWYFTHFKKLILETKVRMGVVSPYGDKGSAPIYERLFAGGGDTIRGYKERGVGPKDPVTNDPIGGEAMVVANIEYTFPIVDFLKGAVFFDAGNVWEKTKDFGLKDYRYGTGFGARIKTPLGPVKLDYGFPLKIGAGDKKGGKFYFSMSHGF